MLVDTIIPHHCLNCQKVGQILCHRCKNYILNQLKNDQKVKPAPFPEFDCLFYFADQNHLLKKLIYQYKLGAIKDMAPILADYMVELIPENSEFVLIPLPTAKKHIKMRGFDHILEIGRCLSDKTDAQLVDKMSNQTTKSQKDLSAAARRANVKGKFSFDGRLNPEKHYLLIDDIITTGATARACAKELRRAGATKISLLVLTDNH